MSDEQDETGQVLERLRIASEELSKATAAAIELAGRLHASTLARSADDDDWLPLPQKRRGSKCAITGWSRSKLLRFTTRHGGAIRIKSVGRTPYYSGNDARKLITEQG